MNTLSPTHLSELMSLLAHDLRNPLSALLTNVDFIRSTVRGRAPDIAEALSDAALSCTMLGQVIGNLDVLSRAFSETTWARHPTALRQAAQECVTRFVAQAELNRVSVEISTGGPSPILLVDPRFFSRALDNVMANALQYSPADGKVRFEFVVTEDRGAVVILDDGPAVPVDLRPTAVSAEGQIVAKHRYEARYGRGLGLFCAAEAARLAGADLELGDRAGRASMILSAPIGGPVPTSTVER